MISREESSSSGIYFLTGLDPVDGSLAVYIGVAESIKDRIKNHLHKEFWNQILFFVSKDDNLTRAHILYCEGRLIEIAKSAGRSYVMNNQGSGSKLPESDRADMEIFLEKMLQLLPALGVEHFVPKVIQTNNAASDLLTCEIKGLKASGYRTPNGMVVLKDSQAVLETRVSTNKYPWAATMRNKLMHEGALIAKDDCLMFIKDSEFSSPSAAAAVIHGGQANGLTAWKNNENKSLKQLEAD